MVVSSVVERRETLHPALQSIHRDSGHGAISTRDDHCLGVRVLNGTRITVINTITRRILMNYNNLYILCFIFKRKAKLLAPFRFDESS